MHALKLNTFTLADGKTVDWRADLFAAIKAHGKEIPLGDKKGMMFMNDAPRWGECFPTLATAYLIKALKDIDASAARSAPEPARAVPGSAHER